MRSRHQCQAFTVFEGLVVGTVLLLLLAVLLPILAEHSDKASKIHCINNLIQIGTAFRIWEGDNGDKYPMDVPAASGGAQELIATGNVAACFELMSNELARPRILVCPADSRRRFATNFALTPANVSYFIGFDVNDSNPAALLSGDANLSLNSRPVTSGIVNLCTNTAIWTSDRHHGSGNVLVADGSVQVVTRIGFTSSAGAWFATNRLAVP